MRQASTGAAFIITHSGRRVFQQSHWGIWHPTGSSAAAPEKDYVTTIQIFANPIEPTNQFFSRLKQILKTGGSIEQEEILISRFDCWLM